MMMMRIRYNPWIHKLYIEVKQRTGFIHVASRETANVYIYVGARFFQFFLAVDFICNILGKFCFRSRKKGAFTLSSLKSLEV